MPSESHIVPVVVGNPQRCKAISDELLLRFGRYIHFDQTKMKLGMYLLA